MLVQDVIDDHSYQLGVLLDTCLFATHVNKQSQHPLMAHSNVQWHPQDCPTDDLVYLYLENSGPHRQCLPPTTLVDPYIHAFALLVPSCKP